MKIPKALKILGLTSALGIGSLGTTNYYFFHNVKSDTGGVAHLRKMDGVVAHAELEIHYQQKPFFVMHVYDPFGQGYKRYSDGDADGNLDAVTMTKPFTLDEGTFNTKNHAQTHPDLLERENKLYQQNLKEFMEKYPEEFKRFGLENIIKP